MPATRPHALSTARKAGLFAAALAGLGAAIIFGPLAGPRASAQPTADTSPAAGGFSPEQRGAIEKIVKDYLVANPEVFLEVQGALEAKMEKQQAEKLKVALGENAEEIFRRKDAPIAGNANGDVTVVEFFDYNCGYCKRGLPDLAKLVESDSKVKVVLKELPILSKGSEEAARVALAARIQGKYWEVHQALLTMKGQANEVSALNAAGKLGLDMAKLKADMTSDAVNAEIASVQALAQKLGVNGTPHFLIGDRSIAGAPDDLYEQLSAQVAELRKTGCKMC